jgi:hypothetical protein
MGRLRKKGGGRGVQQIDDVRPGTMPLLLPPPRLLLRLLLLLWLVLEGGQDASLGWPWLL